MHSSDLVALRNQYVEMICIKINCTGHFCYVINAYLRWS